MEDFTQKSLKKFKQQFPNPHNFVVSLHSQSILHALEGAEISFENGADGIAIVTHKLTPVQGITAANSIKQAYPYHKVILNILQMQPKELFASLAGVQVDGIRADNAKIYGVDQINDNEKKYADDIKNIQEKIGWKGLYFGGLDFKYQKKLKESEYNFAIEQAKKYLDVITTSGSGTGYSADVNKVKKIKSLAGQHPFGLASGISSENINDYVSDTDISIVATSISHDYRNLDPTKVKELANKIRTYNRQFGREQYEKEIIETFKINSISQLNQKLQEQGIINIGLKNGDETEKKLSNLYPSAFTLDGVEYASVEAFRMSIKYPPNDPRRETIRSLSGIEAKSSGNEAKFNKIIFYNGQEILVGSQQHHDLIKRAIKAKLQQNPDILQGLLATENRKIVHLLVDKNGKLYPDSWTIPARIFSRIVMELREELKVTSE